MGIIFVLKRNHLDLAAAEVKALSYGWQWWEHREKLEDGTLFLRNMRKTPRHLALTRHTVKVLAVVPVVKLKKTLSSLDWKRILRKKKYRVTLTKCVQHRISEKEIADTVWHAANKNVNLRNSAVTIEIVLTKKNAYIGIRDWISDDDFGSRKAHRWPAMHPSAMHPALARALVNLTAAARVHDPFCGAGGFLIEAGRAGKQTSGADIDQVMIRRARMNSDGFLIKPELRVADATDWLPRVQAIVTDLPYGRNTRKVRTDPLIEAFLTRAVRSTRRVVIGLSSQKKFPKRWHVRAHFSSYIHGTMTRHFYVLERAR